MWTARFFSASINSSRECDQVNPCAQHGMQKTSGQKINKKDIVEKETIFHITFLFIYYFYKVLVLSFFQCMNSRTLMCNHCAFILIFITRFNKIVLYQLTFRNHNLDRLG